MSDPSPRTGHNTAAKENVSHLVQAVEAIRDYGIFMLDERGNIRTWNRGAERIKGYRREEVLGKHFSLFYTEADRLRGHPAAELRAAKRNGRYEEEGWRVRKDGSRFWASVVITRVLDERGRLVGFSKVTRDLTLSRRLREELTRAKNELERRVLERTAELSEANARLARREKELRQAVATRDEFLTVASHELKTPITSLKLQIQMLQRRYGFGDPEVTGPEQLTRFLAASLRQVDRLTGLVEDLLDVTRAGSRKLQFRFEETELRALTLEVIERFRLQAETAGCEVFLRSSASLRANLDRYRIEQLLVNLLANALKFAPGKPVEVTLERKGKKAILGVQDGGSGVPAETRRRLFGRFERGENARNFGGLGLGLFLCREIALGHGGKVRLGRRGAGRGAHFVVELPLDLPATERGFPTNPPPETMAAVS